MSSAALLLLALALAAHVRLGLGHWPQPMWEDYSTFGYQLHQLALIAVGLFVLYGAVPLWIICVSVRRFRATRRMHLTQAVVYVLGWGFLVGFVALDPYQFVTWFLD